MTVAYFCKRILSSKKGQSLIELTFIAPLMLLLIFGVVEVGSVISTYLRIAQLTREGANLTSRGDPCNSPPTSPCQALDDVKKAALPFLGPYNQAQWKIIYSKITQDPTVPCNPPLTPCRYIISYQNNSNSYGTLGRTSQIGNLNDVVTLPGVATVQESQTFHAIEIFYDYGPSIITYVGKMINRNFYERTIFTDVSGKP